MSREWVLEMVINSAGWLEIATRLKVTLRIATIIVVSIGNWGTARAPHRRCQRASSGLWAEGAQEESRIGMMGRKEPEAGRQVPVESIMLPPDCVTLGK